jgi:hypothetical protein
MDLALVTLGWDGGRPFFRPHRHITAEAGAMEKHKSASYEIQGGEILENADWGFPRDRIHGEGRGELV